MWHKKPRILHVEDDPGVQALVRAALTQLGGFVVESAGDAFRALAIAAERTPDLVILDLELPGANGLDSMHALRALDGMERVPVIFLTASSDMLKAVEMIAAGAVSVLQKPCSPRRLLEAANEALGRKWP
jgi:DNA-binding response OmpR family regulator